MNNQPEQNTGSAELHRRTVLKSVGVSAVGIAGFAGASTTAAASGEKRTNFYGCSQVCADSTYAFAVIWTGDRHICKRINNASNRNDPPVRDWDDVYCASVDESDHAIVGVCPNGMGGDYIENPNRCARNYPQIEENCQDICNL